MDKTENICKYCIWGDECHEEGGCEHFDPTDYEAGIDITSLHNKKHYKGEWFRYLRDRNGEF